MLKRSKDGQAAWQKERRERAGRRQTGPWCDWFAKVAPIGTGVALSLQGFAGTKLWITTDQDDQVRH